MTVAVLWVANPTAELSTSFGFLHSVRVLDSSKFGSCDRNLMFKGRTNKGGKQKFKTNIDLRNHSNSKIPVISGTVATPAGELAISSEEKVYNVVMKQAALVKEQLSTRKDFDVEPDIVLPGNLGLLSEAYDRCDEVCAKYAKTFYLGTLLMAPERRRAIWAIYGILNGLMMMVWTRSKGLMRLIVVNWYEKDYSVVTIRGKDKEYNIRHTDGSPLKSEAKRQRVIQYIELDIRSLQLDSAEENDGDQIPVEENIGVANSEDAHSKEVDGLDKMEEGCFQLE